MKWKKISVLLLCASMLTACQRINTEKVSLSYEEQQIEEILADAKDGEAANIHGISNVYDKAISLVFEGFTDEATMMRLADMIAEYDVEAIMFIPGDKIQSHPDLIQYLVDKKIEIGNYGLTGEEELASSNDTKIARQIYLSNEYLKQAVNKYPDYFNANRSEYSESMLRIVEAAGLKGVVKPSVYLNYKSFINLEKATEYTTNNLRGDIVSFKLSGELNETEVVNKKEEDEKPAVDKQPTVLDEIEEVIEDEVQDIVEVVEWFIQGCQLNNVSILSLADLEECAQDALVSQEVPLELMNRLDMGLYPNLTTDFKFGLQEGEKVDHSYFDDTVFVGDSIMEGIEGYVNLKRQTNKEFLGKAQFLAMRGMSASNALWEISDESRHPIYNGERMLVQDAIGMMEGIKKVYLLLGLNDILLSDSEEHLENYQALVQLIKQQSPQVEIYIISITPGTDIDELEPNNTQVFERNMILIEWCAMYNYNYVDLAYALRNETGGLPTQWCIDTGGQGYHLNVDGIDAVWEFLYTHTK